MHIGFYVALGLFVLLFLGARLGGIKETGRGTAVVFGAMAVLAGLFGTWDTLGFLVCAGGIGLVPTVLPKIRFQKKTSLLKQRIGLVAGLCAAASFFMPGVSGVFNHVICTGLLIGLTVLFPLFYVIPQAPLLTGWAFFLGMIGVSSLKPLPAWEMAALSGWLAGMTGLALGGRKGTGKISPAGVLTMGFVWAFVMVSLWVQKAYTFVGMSYAYYLAEGILVVAATYYKTGTLWPLQPTRAQKRFEKTDRPQRFYRHFFTGMLMLSVFGMMQEGAVTKTPLSTALLLGLILLYAFKGFQPVPYKRVTYAQIWGDMIEGVKVLGKEAKQNFLGKK